MAFAFDPYKLSQPTDYELSPFTPARGTLANLGIGFGGSFVQSLGGIYNAARFASNYGLPEFDMNKMYEDWVGQTGYDATGKDIYEEFFNKDSDYWKTGQGARDIGGIGGSIVGLLAPQLAAAKGLSVAGKALGIAKEGGPLLTTASKIFGGTISGLTESASEYGSNRAEAEQLLAEGKTNLTQADIEQRSKENFIANLGFTMGGDVLMSLGAFAAPGGKVLKKVLQDEHAFRNVTGKMVGGAMGEYIQENLQTQSGSYVKGQWDRPYSPHDVSAAGLSQTASVLLPQNQTQEEKLSSLLGGLSGGVFGGVGGIASRFMRPTEQAQQPITPVTPVTQPAVAPIEQVITPTIPIAPTEGEAIVGQMPGMEQPYAGEIQEQTPLPSTPIIQQQVETPTPVERRPLEPPIKQEKPQVVNGLTYTHVGDVKGKNAEGQLTVAPIIEVEGRRLLKYKKGNEISLIDYDTGTLLVTRPYKAEENSIAKLYQDYKDEQAMAEFDKEEETTANINNPELFGEAQKFAEDILEQDESLLEKPEQWSTVASQINQTIQEATGKSLSNNEINALQDHIEEIATKKARAKRTKVEVTKVPEPIQRAEFEKSENLGIKRLGDIQVRFVANAKVGEQWITKRPGEPAFKFATEEQADAKAYELAEQRGQVVNKDTAETPTQELIMQAMEASRRDITKVAPIKRGQKTFGFVANGQLMSQRNLLGKVDIIDIATGETVVADLPDHSVARKEMQSMVMELAKTQGKQQATQPAQSNIKTKQQPKIDEQTQKEQLAALVEKSKTSDEQFQFGDSTIYKGHMIVQHENTRVSATNTQNQHRMEYESMNEALADIDKYTAKKQSLAEAVKPSLEADIANAESQVKHNQSAVDFIIAKTGKVSRKALQALDESKERLAQLKKTQAQQNANKPKSIASEQSLVDKKIQNIKQFINEYVASGKTLPAPKALEEYEKTWLTIENMTGEINQDKTKELLELYSEIYNIPGALGIDFLNWTSPNISPVGGNIRAELIGTETQRDIGGNDTIAETGQGLQQSEVTQRRNLLWNRILAKIPIVSDGRKTIANDRKFQERIVDIFEKLSEDERHAILQNPYINIELINDEIFNQYFEKYKWLPSYVEEGIRGLNFRAMVNGSKVNNPFARSTLWINSDEIYRYTDFDKTVVHELSHVMDYALDSRFKDVLDYYAQQLFDAIPTDIRVKVKGMKLKDKEHYGNIDFINQILSTNRKAMLDIKNILENNNLTTNRLARLIFDVVKAQQQLVYFNTDMAKYDSMKYDDYIRERNANIMTLFPRLREHILQDYKAELGKPYSIEQYQSLNHANRAFLNKLLPLVQFGGNKQTKVMDTLSALYDDVYNKKITPIKAYDKLSEMMNMIYTSHIQGNPTYEEIWEKTSTPDVVSMGSNIMYEVNSSLNKFVRMGKEILPENLQKELDEILNTKPPEGITITGQQAKSDMGWWTYALKSPSVVALKNKYIEPIINMALKAQKHQERLRADLLHKINEAWNLVKINKQDYQKFMDLRLQADSIGRDLVETFKLPDSKFVNLTWTDDARMFSNEADAHNAKIEMAKLYKYTEVIGDGTKFYTLGWNNAGQKFDTKEQALNDKRSRSLEVGHNFGFADNHIEASLKMREVYDHIWDLMSAIRKSTGLQDVDYQHGYLRHQFDTWIVTIKQSAGYPIGTELIYKDTDGTTHKVTVLSNNGDMYTVESKSGKRDINKSLITRVIKYPEGYDKNFTRMSFPSLKEAIEEAKRQKQTMGEEYSIEIRNKFADSLSGIGDTNNEVRPETSLTEEEKAMFAESIALTDNDFNTWLKNPDTAYPKLADAIGIRETWDNKSLRAAIHHTGAKGEIYRSGIYQFIGKRENITKQELLNYLDHAGTRNRYFEALQKRQGVEGWAKDLERVDNNYVLQSSRYIAMQPFKHNSILWYNKVFNTDFYKNTPPTRAAKWTKEYMADMFGIPTEYEMLINQTINDMGWLGKWLQENLGDRPSLALAGRINAFNTYTKLGLYRMSSAILQLAIFLNINAKLDHAGYGRFVGFGPMTRKYMSIANQIGGYMKSGKSTNSRAAEYAEVLKYANLDTDFITMANEGGYSAFSVTPTEGKIKSKLRSTIKGSLYFFLKADMWGRRTAMLGFYDQGLAKGMSKQQAMEYAEKEMLATNFNQSVADSPNMFRRFGPIGQILLQFKKYPVKQFEFMTGHLDGAEKKTFWTSYFLMCGAFGVPAMDWLKELLKGMFDFDVELGIKREVMKMAGDSPTGQVFAKQMFYGLGASLPSAFGFNDLGMDIHSRIGLSDMMPTRLRDLGGPMFSTMASVINHVNEGNRWDETVVDVMSDFSPVVRDAKHMVSGEVRSDYNRDRLVMELSPVQRALRAFGFKPAEQSVRTDQERIIKYTEDVRKKESKKLIDDYIKNRDSDSLAALREAGITTKQVKDEIKRKQTGTVERAIDATALKRRGQFKDIVAFEKE